MRLFLVVLAAPLAVIALHFRPPLYDPLTPEKFGEDLVDLELREAPRDAQIVFLGDSITERWRFREALWQQSFGRFHPANLGVGGSRVSNLLWLVNSGRLSAFHPKMFVIRIGENDVHGPTLGFFERRRPSAAKVEAGVRLITESLHKQFPDAEVVVTPFPPAQDLAEDGIHLNDEGYKHWATQLNPIVTAKLSAP